MKVKSFKKYLDERLDPEEIDEIEAAAKLEAESLKVLQQDISMAVINYMSNNGIGFNEFVRRLGKSPTQVSKIIKGEANLTLATIAQIYALMNCKPHLIAKQNMKRH